MEGIEIGLIKFYDEIKKFGFIRCFDENDIFFHISDSCEKRFNIGDIVGFSIQQPDIFSSKNKAVNVKLAEDLTEEFRRDKDKFCNFQWGMILKGNNTLFEEYVFSEACKANISLIAIQEYVDSFDLNHFINLYQVKVISGGRNKPGDDDMVWVDIASSWLPIGKWLHLPDEVKKDVYLNQLLPSIRKEKFRKRAFCTWSDMENEYREDRENWIKLEAEASQMEFEIKQKAKETYNRVQHIKALYDKEIDMVRDRCHADFYPISDHWKYARLMMSATFSPARFKK